MPGMSSPSTHNRQSTMKVHVGAWADGFSAAEQIPAAGPPLTHGDMASTGRLSPQGPSVQTGGAWKLSSLLLDHNLTQRPFLCFGWHAGTVLPFRDSHAALDLMKWCIHFFHPVFSLSRCGSGSASGQKYIPLVDPGNVCRNPRISEIEELSVHLHAPFFPLHTGLTYSSFIR